MEKWPMWYGQKADDKYSAYMITEDNLPDSKLLPVQHTKILRDSVGSEHFWLTKDQDEECVQRHHPEHVFLGETQMGLSDLWTVFCLKKKSTWLKKSFSTKCRGGFLELAVEKWDYQSCWQASSYCGFQIRAHWKLKPSALTKNTKEPSRPNIWDKDKEQYQTYSSRM